MSAKDQVRRTWLSQRDAECPIVDDPRSLSPALSAEGGRPVFVDRVEIDVQAGNGGNGCMSFRRERYIPRGGPDGGNGGDGGSVVLIAKSGVNNLSSLVHRRHWKAEAGKPGQGSNRHGRGGADLIIELPPGTLVKDADQGFVLKDLAVEGDQVTAARGGKGGRGNTHFKSATNRAPREVTQGEEGEFRRLHLELKLIADVGLLGKPNAGKSTLLSRMTRARPEIANYPFTTKSPHLGIVRVNLDRSFVIADIPGLIEGAHSGAGLGHEFLRHVERTRVLVHMVEPVPMDGTDPLENYRAIRSELEQYDAELAKRPEILVISKAELPEAEEIQQQFEAELDRKVMSISAVTGQNLNHLSRDILSALDDADATDADA